MREQLEALVRAHALDARLTILDHRASDRGRIDLALEHGTGDGQIMFHGIDCAVVQDVPRGPLRVVGDRVE